MTNKENIHRPKKTALSASEIAEIDFAPIFIGHWPHHNEAEPEKDVYEAIEAIARAHLDNGIFRVALFIPDPDNETICCPVFDLEEDEQQSPGVVSKAINLFETEIGHRPFALCVPFYFANRNLGAVLLLWFTGEGNPISSWFSPVIRDDHGWMRLYGEWVEVKE